MCNDVFVTNWLDVNNKAEGIGSNPMDENFITNKLKEYDPDN
jgi:hypothetical protein